MGNNVCDNLGFKTIRLGVGIWIGNIETTVQHWVWEILLKNEE